MLLNFFKKIFENRNDKILRKFKNIVNHINSLEDEISKISDYSLKYKTQYFKNCIKMGKNLDDILPEAFAVVREASKRVFNMRIFDVQLLGGIVLYKNCIAEMRTGEGKTLTSTLSAYLNALTGNGVHIVTINEYLAKRDAKKNEKLFNFLGLTVGINLSGMSTYSKKQSYICDVVYGTSSEFCFDYLRDNMVFNSFQRVQRRLNYVIIDEVDSILIDDARTPIVISGESQCDTKIYYIMNSIALSLIKHYNKNINKLNKMKYFIVNAKYKQIVLTELGLIKLEMILVKKNIINKKYDLYSINNIIFIDYIISALKAHYVFVKNIDYIIQNKSVIIVDDNTGRIMVDRRWSYGLHQAIEAKENLKVLHENQTLASITLQNYFKLYKNISGMTGTAFTESFEFNVIYNLDTIVIPTNSNMIRNDLPDLVYITEIEKINAIVKDIKCCISKQQPVLVGTSSIEKSEMISSKLKELGIKHNVLNAKLYKKESDIILAAGKLSTVTISTNMAGRGTDIVLGGIKKNGKIDDNEYNLVKLSGGLHVIGTERNESRRIDNQLRGRSGRQGDPGSSRFYLSLEDSLIRNFVPKKIKDFIISLNLKFGQSIENPLIISAISYAQKKIENKNFNIRKQLLEYDDILNIQRYIIYLQRNLIIDSKNLKCIIMNNIKDVILYVINNLNVYNFSYNNDYFFSIKNIFKKDFNLELCINDFIKDKMVFSNIKIFEKIFNLIVDKYEKKEIQYDVDNILNIEKQIMLKNLDMLWREHLSSMEYLRKAIHLRVYAHKNPKQEYQIESFKMFVKMLDLLKYDTVSEILKNIF